MKNHTFIELIETEMTGGGCMIDFVYLKNGQVLAIDNNLVGLYDSIDDFWDGRDGNWDHVKTIELKENEDDDDEC
jgi:hypothetical protein